MKRETYPAAQARLFAEFRALGFIVKDNLKIPQVKLIYAECERTLFFHAQALYLDDLSMFLDYRGMSADMLLAIAEETHKSRLKIKR